jgi:hypothetical protein
MIGQQHSVNQTPIKYHLSTKTTLSALKHYFIHSAVTI